VPPMMVAAMTGPTLKTSVSVVPAAATTAVILFLVSRIWASMRARSSVNAPASPDSQEPQPQRAQPGEHLPQEGGHPVRAGMHSVPGPSRRNTRPSGKGARDAGNK
jgi:hypothetical protein